MNTFLDTSKAKLDKDGIWISKLQMNKDVENVQKKWEEIYNFKDTVFVKDREDFNMTKLQDHINFIKKSYTFTSKTTYLEIGCGPAYIGEYLMQKYNCHFIGVDFNYPFLVVLKKYLDKKGYKKITLIYADINDMPLKRNSIDYIYGGGVIEHLKDTKKILTKLYEVLAPKGVSFNSVPAFNLWWLMRCYYSIPSIAPLRQIFEYFHENVMDYKILSQYFGYELSFTKNHLKSLHNEVGFRNIHTGAFAFHPSLDYSAFAFLGELYYKMSQSMLFSPMHYIYGSK